MVQLVESVEVAAIPSPPVLSGATATSTGTQSGEGSVDTDTAQGTRYFIVTTSTTEPSPQQIKDGKRADGTTADASGSETVTSTGTSTDSVSGLLVGSVYTFFWVQETTEGFSNVASASFSTEAESFSASLDLTNNDPSISVLGSASGGSSPYNYQWDFGDGVTATGQNESHTYQADGTYTVALTVTDDNGNTATDSTNINIVGAGVEAVNDLTASLGTEEVVLDWTSSLDTDLAEERLYRSTSTPVDPANDTLVASVNAPSGGASQSVTDNGVTDGQTYYYVVQTEDTSGNTALSGEVSATLMSSIVVGQINYDFSEPDYSGTGATV